MRRTADNARAEPTEPDAEAPQPRHGQAYVRAVVGVVDRGGAVAPGPLLAGGEGGKPRGRGRGPGGA
ncbi:hypothetical protein ACFWIZ_49045, partial [Streptomyces sp. NPDC127044]